MNDEVKMNKDMANKDHILSCDSLGTSVPEALRNVQMSLLTLKEDNIQCVDKKASHYNNCEDSFEQIQSSEYVNYYDNESYVSEQLKTEFPEDVLPQSDCSLNSQIHSENKELLKCIAKAELNNENIEDELSLNIKEENYYNEYPFTVKTEEFEEQEDVQCKFYHNTLNNGCNLLQNSNKHIKLETNTPVDNRITELHQCKYCGKGFDNYNNILVHISNDHKQEKFKCDICGKHFKSVGNLNRHILVFHKFNKPLEPITEHCHVDFQHKYLLNDHSKLSCSDKEDGENESENKVTRNIMNCDYRTMLGYRYEKQFLSLIHLRQHQKLIHRPKIPKTNNERIQCDSCKKSFKTKANLVRHIMGVHFDYGRKFKCWCAKEFRSPLHLHQHEKLVHKRNVQYTNNSELQCDYCKVFYKSKRCLYLHIKRVHYDYGKRFDCWCGKQFRSPIHLREHDRYLHRHNVQNINKSKWQCGYCKNFMKSKSSLLLHIKRIHHDYGKRFDCWCGKQFRSPLHLHEHEKRIHPCNVQNNINGKFQCDYCKVFIIKKRNLILHIKRVHYDYGRVFKCWCGKQFRSPLDLREHKSGIHKRNADNTNNEKFQCDFCKIFLLRKPNLIVHIRRFHYDYGKRFDCCCGKQYRSPIQLREHQKKVHQPKNPKTIFQCDYCKKFFATKCTLSRHIKSVHVDYGRKFECWCGKEYRSPIHLQKHQRRIHKDSVQNTNTNIY